MTGLGTFAELMTVQQMSVVKVETDLPDEQLALIGCGVTTGVGAALNTAQVEPGAIVAVIGCGGVGQAVIQGARIAGAARIIAIDPVALKRDVGGHERGDARDRPDRGRPGRGREGAQWWAGRRLRVRGDRHRGDGATDRRQHPPRRHRGDGGRAEARHRRVHPGDDRARGEEDLRAACTAAHRCDATSRGSSA